MESIRIIVNGQPQKVPPGTVADLLRHLGLADQPVVIEHNGTALLPKEYHATSLTNDDRLECVRIVAGG